jgi:tryptophan-rich sensory protein
MSCGFILGVLPFRVFLSLCSLCPVTIVDRGFDFVRNICFLFYTTSVSNTNHSSVMFYTRYLEYTGCITCYIFIILTCCIFIHTAIIAEIWGFVGCDAVLIWGVKRFEGTLPSELLVITYGVTTLKITL